MSLARDSALVVVFSSCLARPSPASSCMMLVLDLRHSFLSLSVVSLLSLVLGMVVGLVAVTPAAGYIGPLPALAFGALGSAAAFSALGLKSKYVDLLDSLHLLSFSSLFSFSIFSFSSFLFLVFLFFPFPSCIFESLCSCLYVSCLRLYLPS